MIITLIGSRKTEIRQRLTALCQKCSRHVSLEFNWAWVVFFAFFIVYGYYGALAPAVATYKTNLIFAVGQLVLLCGIQVAFGWAAWKKPDSFKDSISINAQDVLVCISVVLVGLVFSYDRLQYSLYSDEISYAGSAHGHSIYMALMLAKYLPMLSGVSSQYLIQLISLILLASLTALIFLSTRWTPTVRIAAFLILLLLGRMVFAVKGGNGSPHPPLHLLPLFISGSFLGISDLSFKLSYFLTYAVFLTLLYKMLLRVFPKDISYVSVLAIGTIPLLSYLSTVVEHSFWAFICFTLIFVEIITSPRLNVPRLISVVSIAATMRQPSFLALLPIILLVVAETSRSSGLGRWMRESWVILLPILLFLPILVSGLMYGTPSTDALGRGSMITRVILAIENGVVLESVCGALPLWWLIFMPIALFPLSMKLRSLNGGILLFSVAAVSVYYSIHPSLWGYAKYQAEYAAPVAIAGLLLLILWVSKLKGSRYLLLTCSMVLLILNIRELAEAPHLKQIEGRNLEADYNSILDIKTLKHLVVALPYEYKNAHAFIKQAKLDGATYSIGATYGVLPEIMNGYSVAATRASYDIYIGQEANRLKAMKTGVDVELIVGDQSIQVIMIGAVSGKQKLIEDFRRKSWEQLAAFKNMQYGTTVLIMKRPASASELPALVSRPQGQV